MTDDDKSDLARLVQHMESDDAGRDDLTGGLGYVLIAWCVICLGAAVALGVWVL